MDFSLQKDTRFTENKALQLRIEFYNIFNHTNFANPVGDIGSAISDRLEDCEPTQILARFSWRRSSSSKLQPMIVGKGA